jgi:hypothetical protein
MIARTRKPNKERLEMMRSVTAAVVEAWEASRPKSEQIAQAMPKKRQASH